MNTTPEVCRVLSRVEAAAFLKISIRTLDRMHDAGDGPAQVRLSQRRIGYLEGDLSEWLRAQREVRQAA